MLFLRVSFVARVIRVSRALNNSFNQRSRSGGKEMEMKSISITKIHVMACLGDHFHRGELLFKSKSKSFLV